MCETISYGCDASCSASSGGFVFKRNSNIFLEITETLLLAALIFLGTRLLVQNFRVEGPSMLPSLGDAEFLVVNKLAYLNADPGRGDVIVFRSPRSPEEDLVKRIVGLPKEPVEIRNGQVFVNGQVLDEATYIQDDVARNTPATTVPADAYFVMGDNRRQSRDSRDIGAIPRASIVGRVWVVYWPFNKLGLLPYVDPAIIP